MRFFSPCTVRKLCSRVLTELVSGSGSVPCVEPWRACLCIFVLGATARLPDMRLLCLCCFQGYCLLCKLIVCLEGSSSIFTMLTRRTLTVKVPMGRSACISVQYPLDSEGLCSRPRCV